MRRLLSLIDAWYRRRHRLRRIGPMLHVGRTRYRGPARLLRDGTKLVPGAAIGTLHFDNDALASLRVGTQDRNGMRFVRRLRTSLQELANLAQSDPALRELVAFNGITWLAPHGQRVGFEIEDYPDGFRKSLLRAHFRLLAWGFGAAARIRNDPTPRVFWLTRAALLRHFAAEPTGSVPARREA